MRKHPVGSRGRIMDVLRYDDDYPTLDPSEIQRRLLVRERAQIQALP